MIHKGLAVFGSAIAIAPFLGSAGYFIIPPFMKTLPRHISQVKSGSECFTALTGKDKVGGTPEKDWKNSYLLVCRTSNSDDLNFYYYVVDGGKIATPVKLINVEGGRNDRDVTIKFFWKSNSTLQYSTYLDSVQWISKDGKDYELKDFCERTELKSLTSSTYNTSTLVCHRKAEGREKQEMWGQFTNWGN
ncbi:hypothetical protein WEN_01835 [Mycoplasma wenyonii str. Massachusetts]|uniref:Uncharacterized protein n=1 Tax=Mycoplasma wenyonii (strain Massachusetts) TaxID=1197325 RepID=I6ZIX9_MYCWM|nr:hypothetical protein [Mycoplasma wenyonii]AFN65160.1 hypothetical protein WEN_01835 [Mycoplasma wenyonii str. Massachusetts]